jgi:hypothetical protein
LRLNNFFNFLIKFSIPVGLAVVGLYIIYSRFFGVEWQMEKLLFSFTATVFTYQLIIYNQSVLKLNVSHKTWILFQAIISFYFFIHFDDLTQLSFIGLSLMPLFYLKIRKFAFLKLFFICLSATIFPYILTNMTLLSYGLTFGFLLIMFVLQLVWMFCFEIIDAKNGDNSSVMYQLNVKLLKKYVYATLLILLLIVLHISSLNFLLPLIVISLLFFYLSLKSNNIYLTKIWLELLPLFFGIYLIISSF